MEFMQMIEDEAAMKFDHHVNELANATQDNTTMYTQLKTLLSQVQYAQNQIQNITNRNFGHRRGRGSGRGNVYGAGCNKGYGTYPPPQTKNCQAHRNCPHGSNKCTNHRKGYKEN